MLSLCWHTSIALSVLTIGASDLFTAHDFDSACASAKERGKLVLIAFCDEQNAEHTKLIDDTFADPDVIAWIKPTCIGLRPKAGMRDALAERFEVTDMPSILLLDPSGRVRARLPRLRNPSQFLVEVKNKLAASDQVGLAQRRLKTDKDAPLAARLTYARALEEEGNLDEALKEYMLCVRLRSGSSSAGPSGVETVGTRLVAIEEIARLSERSSAAREALARVRDECRARILGGTAGMTDPVVFTSASARLDDLSGVLDTYHRMAKESPGSLTGRLLRESIVEALLEARRYSDISSLIDVPRRFRLAHDQFQRDVARPLPSGPETDRFRAFQREAFVTQAVKWYEMLIGTEQATAADDVAQALLAIDNSPNTYHALAASALRTGRLSEKDLGYARQAVEAAEPLEADMVITLVGILRQMDRLKEARQFVDTHANKLADEVDRSRVKASLNATHD